MTTGFLSKPGFISAIGFKSSLGFVSYRGFSGSLPPPVGSQLIVKDNSSEGGAGSTVYDLNGDYVGQPEGSLLPSITLPDFGIIKLILSFNNGIDPKIIVMQFDNTFPGSPVLATFNGQPYSFTFNPSYGYTVESDALFDFLTANQNTPIVFSAEIAPPPSDFADNGDFANNGDFEQ